MGDKALKYPCSADPNFRVWMAESAYLVTSILRSNTHVTTLSFDTTKMATWVKSYDPSMANVPYFAIQVPCDKSKNGNLVTCINGSSRLTTTNVDEIIISTLEPFLTIGYAAGAGGVTSFIHRAEQSGTHRRNYVFPPSLSTTVARRPSTRAARTLQTQGAS